MEVHDPITLASLFDGIGGFPYAASFYGIHSLWASEIVPECVSVTRRHFPDMVHMGDVTQLHGGTVPPVDIITFGSPCQGLSTAGLRRGLADERSGLFMEAIRIIDEMRESTHGKYPKFALFENVPGALSSAGGRDFAAVLQAFTKAEIPMPRSGRWANTGMVRGGGVDLAWVIYDAQHFGTAQRRKRLFLICDFRGKSAGEILFVPKSLRGYFEAGGTPKQGLAAFAESGAGAAGRDGRGLNEQVGNLPVMACMGTGQANASILSDQSPVLTASHEHPVLFHPQIAGTLCASGAGLSRPAGMKSETDLCIASADLQQMAGSTGCQMEMGQQNSILKAYGISAYYSNCMMADSPTSGYYEASTAKTLDLNGGNPSCNQGGIAIVSAIDCRNFRETAEISGTLQAKTKSGGYSLNYQNPVHIGLCVRRLTPLEAERLMGFPDFWTEYGHDGRAISDTKRYSMLGNSVCTPCVAYIMQGIQRVLQRRI